MKRIADMPPTKPAYSREFREGAVDLLISSARPLKHVAEELGVTPNTLRLWRNRAAGIGGEGRDRDRREPGEMPSGASDPDEASELKRLRRENEQLRRQRDILKKAASILAEDPHLGMR